MNELMWKPSEERIQATNMYDFIGYINKRYNKQFSLYDELWQWSVDNISSLWEALWDYLDIIHSKPYDNVLVDGDKMPGAKWFTGARLNFAENLLRYRDARPAIIAKGEKTGIVEITYEQLYDRVARLAKSMRKLLSRCCPPHLSAPHGHPVPPTSESAEYSIDSAR